MESFFHTLKTELIYFEKYRIRQEARGSVFEYIEIFYNRTRRHSSLNYCSPAGLKKERVKLNWVSTFLGKDQEEITITLDNVCKVKSRLS